MGLGATHSGARQGPDSESRPVSRPGLFRFRIKDPGFVWVWARRTAQGSEISRCATHSGTRHGPDSQSRPVSRPLRLKFWACSRLTSSILGLFGILIEYFGLVWVRNRSFWFCLGLGATHSGTRQGPDSESCPVSRPRLFRFRIEDFGFVWVWARGTAGHDTSQETCLTAERLHWQGFAYSFKILFFQHSLNYSQSAVAKRCKDTSVRPNSTERDTRPNASRALHRV